MSAYDIAAYYWPAYHGNRLAHLKPLFKMISSWQENLRRHAKLYVGIDDGLMLPHAVDDRCKNMGGFWTGTLDHACTSADTGAAVTNSAASKATVPTTPTIFKNVFFISTFQKFYSLQSPGARSGLVYCFCLVQQFCVHLPMPDSNLGLAAILITPFCHKAWSIF